MDGAEIVEDRAAAAFFRDPGTDRARNFLGKILRH